MALSIDQLFKSLSEEEVKATLYDILTSLGFNVTAWQTGGVARTIIAALAKTISGFTLIMSLAIRATFLGSAEGDWLTLLANYVYGVSRIPSTFGTGKLTVTNSGGGLFDIVPGELVVKNPATGKTYKNSAAVTINPSSEIDIDIIAVEAGTDSTTAAGTINTQVTQFLGVSVTNPTPVIGTDEEKDEALRQRCLEALGALSPLGAAAAYSYFAKSALREDGSSVGVNRVKTHTGNIDGEVDVYVLNPSGELSSEDLAIVDEVIQTNATPLAVTSNILNPNPVAVTIKYVVLVDTSVDSDLTKIKDEIEVAINSFMSEFPIGGYEVVDGPIKGAFSWTFLMASISNSNSAVRSIFVTTNGGSSNIPLNYYQYVLHTIDPTSVVNPLP